MHNQQLQTTDNAQIIESLVINGDLSKLTPMQKVDYYKMICQRVGLDPMTQPFKLMKLSGKETMYCDRSGAQQLNKLYNVSHEIKTREVVMECYVVTATAFTPDGRKQESIGAVPIKGKSGEDLCNAMMKAETKAKRRATLDLLGLGILDETEVGTIPNAEVMPIDLQPQQPTVNATDTVSDEDLHMWQDAVNNCNDDAELTKLYNSQKEVTKLPVVKALFTKRKNELKPAQA